MKSKTTILIVALILAILPAVAADLDGLCPQTGIRCCSEGGTSPGDPIHLWVSLCNGYETESLPISLYVILDVFGSCFFWPSWSSQFDFVSMEIPPCSCMDITLLDTTWPQGSSPEDFIFWAAMEVEGEFYFCRFNL